MTLVERFLKYVSFDTQSNDSGANGICQVLERRIGIFGFVRYYVG